MRTGKKYRKIAKAELNFYKKYFLSEKIGVDKWVRLELYQTQLELMGHNTNIIKAVVNTGKIFMRAILTDPLIEEGKKKGKFDNLSIYTATSHASAMTQMLKNNLKLLPNIKDKAQQIKTEKFRSITEHGNEFLRNLKNKKNIIEEEDIIEEEPKKEDPFNDGLSDVSISIIDGAEENHVEIDKMNLDIDTLVGRIKSVFDNQFENLLPSNIKELKIFITTITTQITTICESYSLNLTTIADINKRIKFQAKDYYVRYKELKKNFKKERKELKNKNKMLEFESKHNLDENIKIGLELGDVKNELAFFKNKIGIKDIPQHKDEDILMMVDILNSVKSEIDIYAELADTQKASLNEILEKYKENESENEKNKVNNQIILSEGNGINDDEIINKIEEIVNDNFSKGKIQNIKIDQVNDDTYKFNGKNAVLFLENDTLKGKYNLFNYIIKLVREKGLINFEDWILTNFGIGDIKTQSGNKNSKKGSSAVNGSNGSNSYNTVNGSKMATNIQNMIDKKLGIEKKTVTTVTTTTTQTITTQLKNKPGSIKK
jgi:hypothetical protein